MEYKAVGFDPAMSRANSVAGAAADLERLVSSHATEGWEFLGLQNHSTVVPGTGGCFGLGATSPYDVTVSIAVFYK
jgi:hypothetical protein